MPRHSRNSPPQRGAVLIIVLASILLLSAVVVAFMSEALIKIKYYGLFHNNDDLRVEAYSALETTLAVLNQFQEVDKALYGPQQGWADPLAYAGFTTPDGIEARVVQITDESGKIPLASASEELLFQLFLTLDFEFSEAEHLRDTLMDWMDADDDKRLDGYDSADYEDLDPPYLAANAPLQTWDELRLIEGFRQAFWDEEGQPLPVLNDFKTAVSLYHTGRINVNAAGPLVLETLYDMGEIPDPQFISDYQNGPDRTPGTEDDLTLREANESLLGESSLVTVSSSSFWVEVEARRGDASCVLSTLVTWSGATPSAGQGEELTPETTEPVDEDVSDEEPENREERAQRARGETQTAIEGGSELGYPFTIRFLRENRRI